MGDTILTTSRARAWPDHGDDHARDPAHVDGPSSATINEVQLTDVTETFTSE